MKAIVKEIKKFRSKNKLLISKITVVWVVISAISLVFANPMLYNLLNRTPFKIPFVQTYPAEAFTCVLTIANIIGLVFAFFYSIFEYANVAESREKMKIFAVSLALFISAVLFAGFFSIPTITFFLIGFNVKPAVFDIGMSAFISYCLNIIFLNTLLFELPLLAFISRESLLKIKKQLSANKNNTILYTLLIILFVNFLPRITELLIVYLILKLIYKLILEMIRFLSK